MRRIHFHDWRSPSKVSVARCAGLLLVASFFAAQSPSKGADRLSDLDEPSASVRGSTPSEPPSTAPSVFVRAELRVVVVPQKAALSLVPQLDDKTRQDSALTAIDVMIATGEATVIGTVTARTRDGQSASAEEAKEVRYPTEFEQQKSETGEPMKASQLRPVVPVAFETRKVGISFEITPVFAPKGRSVLCNVKASHTFLLKNSRYECGLTAANEILYLEQPQFWFISDEGTISVRNGKRALFGVHKMPDPPDRFELFLISVAMEGPP